MNSKESLLLKDTQSCEGKCRLPLRGHADLHVLCYYHGAVGAEREKHLTLPQRRRETSPKKAILTFLELHLKEPVGIFQKDKVESGTPFLHTVVPIIHRGCVPRPPADACDHG